jgi:hypothetical protein
MNEIKHTEEVVNYCIDNKVSFAKAYVAITDNKLDTFDKELADLRKDVEFTIEDVRFKL